MSDKTLSGSRLGLAALIVVGTGAMTSATLSPVLLGLFIDQMGFTASAARIRSPSSKTPPASPPGESMSSKMR